MKAWYLYIAGCAFIATAVIINAGLVQALGVVGAMLVFSAVVKAASQV